MTEITQSVSPVTGSAKLAFQLYTLIGLAVFLLMMIVGGLLRASQGTYIGLPSDAFYQLMTLHGAGMVGTAGLAGTAVMWYFLRRYVALSTGVFLAMLLLSLVGVVLIIGGIWLGRYAGAWTFLYPLPAKSMGLWSVHGAAAFCTGLILIGVGFLLFYLDCAIAIIRRYGSLAKGLALDQLFGRAPLDSHHPAAVIAGSMVIIVQTVGILAGAVVLIMTLINLYFPSISFDALLMKNLIYFFGHVFINASIYMAVIGVYEILPHYTGRAWKVNKPFIAAWLAVTFLVMAVYPHHLLMDFVLPKWLAVLGQILSYASGIPVLLVTAYGGLMNIHKSQIKWDLPARLLVLSLFGWGAGVVPAILDAMLKVNLYMHNTLWVPGHFHFYLLVGLLPMLMGTLFYAVTRSQWRETLLDKLAFWVYGLSAITFCMMFLASGHSSVPRRFAAHDAAWVSLSQIAAVTACVLIAATAVLGVRLILRLPKADLTA
ncbi:cbb3-type cytochrome c oxidase subunit I [Sinimarinibacterium sp. NLF-5-8]|uniref:cbb3-type cytochrome c oxidase subunit I n=1 Tax=Sinimarinibacterium sp. NLF-5-8 TaxID=2698684 RepID=UPI00137BBB5C|nr:cbb3-type cytochrome c oxidase subunit I [Sinimarinibacterium sp. NLF-5-8]QHS11215.1 cytochrome C oxidase subunit I [Sinimarinibacterium sp. NLF-5-8]